jgi:predicted amidohydrolase
MTHLSFVNRTAGIIALLLAVAALTGQDGTAVRGQPQAPAGGGAAPRAAARDPNRTVTVAVVQAGKAHSRNGNPGMEANFARLADLARQAAASVPTPDLVCFPEYAISGSPYPTEDAINGLAEPIPGDGPWYGRYRDLARETGVPVLGWLVEAAGGKRYNTAFLLDGRGEFRGKYRKVQANLGEQTWWGWSQGERFELLELDGVRYGVSICADMWFPETVRCQELLGADVVLHVSIADDMGHIIPTRAFDSRLPIVAAIFQGGSYAVDAEGKVLGKLPADEPGWRSFTLEPFRPHLGRKYGGVWDVKKGHQNLRNVGAYSVLTDPATRPPWTAVFMDAEGRPQTREQLLRRFRGRYDAHDPAP